MLNGRVQPRELRLVVEHLLFVIVHDLVQMFFHIHDIHEIAVLVELTALELQFKDVVMRVGIIFRPPISADQKMSCNETSSNSKCVHAFSIDS